MNNKIFFFKDIDSHYVFCLFGIRLMVKHPIKVKKKTISNYGLNTKPRDKSIIVSLTSYPARIQSVHETIITLLNQTVKPDKIILWLSEDEFVDKEENLPSELLALREYGLIINWCNKNVKSYKKLLPALEQYSNEIIITADDDVYYDRFLIESLYNAYLKNPNYIYTRRAVEMDFQDTNLKYISPRKNYYNHRQEPSFLNQQMGGSGCLYPPNSLHKDVFNISLLPTHDDAYFWAMAVLNNTKIQIIDGYNRNLIFRKGTQEQGLINLNKKNNSEGIALEDAHKKILEVYPEILEKIKCEVL